MAKSKVWQEADLIKLAKDNTLESTTLEFKDSRAIGRSDGQLKKISKHISAFANSAGGILIYGISEGPDHKAAGVDEGIDPNDFDKEWLENVIQSNIQPRIQDIRILQIELDRNHQSRLAFVVEIPQSNFAPHQATDKKYYKRRNFHVEPMEDYEVRDTMNRHILPVVRPEFSFRRGAPRNEIVYYTLVINLENEGKVLAKHFSVQFWLPDVPDIIRQGFIRRKTEKTSYGARTLYEYRNTLLGSNINPIRDAVLFPSDSITITDGNNFFCLIGVNDFVYQRYLKNFVIEWKTYADDAQPNTGSVNLTELIDF